MSHEHGWLPIDGQCGRYACGCGATGYRNRTGQVVEHKTKQSHLTAGATRRVGSGVSCGEGNRRAYRRPGAP